MTDEQAALLSLEEVKAIIEAAIPDAFKTKKAAEKKASAAGKSTPKKAKAGTSKTGNTSKTTKK